ncbi:MAG: DUF1080 domain-containing protein [Algoriphagus sp.]|uniref:3-keto-disaccharide hydrolase n=1 Tax=Algoriphagus sp. TaxID=1872435 RepID=UPI00272FDF79|nr:DUF1080 domain-containing protein [Algoriphagus sp.]MDP2042186.1 DUF1080 domain-containing protein [Algoriphagus sp.]MDP3474223.1 DUF1080 domain-containing protein [Algoriphagus sp.]
MKKLFAFLVLCLLSVSAFSQSGEWVELFNGENFDGWKISENPSSFTIVDKTIKVDGPRGHAFYDGPVGNHDFKNFELMVEVKTMPKANSGIFIHTEYQETGWPNKGHEIQVNQTHGDWRKTGSVYSFKDVKETFVEDGEWYTQHVIVKGNQVTVKVNGKIINEYDESKDRTGDLGTKKLSSGTIALQAHDPQSVIYYRSVKIKLLD